MKFLQGITIASTLLFSGFNLTACQNAKAPKQNTADAVAQTDAKPQVNIHAAVMAGDMKAVNDYINAGKDLNVKDPIGGSSPLIVAALFNRTEIVQRLLDAGAQINLQNNDGSTALHSAAFFCRPAVVKILLEKNADKTIKNKYGQTAYETVAGSFAPVKPIYEQLGKALEPMGLKLDFDYIEKTRPSIAASLQ